MQTGRRFGFGVSEALLSYLMSGAETVSILACHETNFWPHKLRGEGVNEILKWRFGETYISIAFPELLIQNLS